MTWINRLKLLGGVIVVLILVAALTLVFNQRQNKVTSYNGQVSADTYTVGADYPGTVVDQMVELDQEVAVGDVLFRVRSLQLREAIEAGMSVTSASAYSVDSATGTITYRAVVDGRVTELTARQGNSIATGGALAVITVDTDPFVTADFLLAPRDYARLESGLPARVLLSNGHQLSGTVDLISASTSERGTVTTVQVVSAELTNVPDPLGRPGAPVTVIVDLKDSGPLAGVQDMLDDFLIKIGLR